MSRGGGYKPYAEGGIINEKQLALLGEDNKQEVVIPMDRNKSNATGLLAYANLKLGVFERFENFFTELLLQIKQSTKDLISTIQSSNESYVLPTLHELPNTTNPTTSTTNQTTNNNTYEISVNYSGNASQNDVTQLALQIQRELQRIEELNNRSYGVIA